MIKNILKMIRITLGVAFTAFCIVLLVQIPQKNVIRDAKSMQKTVDEQRLIGSSSELTGLTREILEINKRIDMWKSLNANIPFFTIYEIDNLKRVK